MDLIYQYFLPYSGEMTNEHDWVELGVESAKQYANKIGVEYRFSDEATMNAPNQNLESCRIFLDPWFDKFDKVLLLDIDTLVNTEDNIFDQEVADIGMVQDGGPGSPKHLIDSLVSKVEKYGGIQFKKSTTFPNEKRYCNGGLQLWSKQGRLKARKLFGGLEEVYRYREATRLNEQPYLNLMLNLHDMEVTELSNEWNRMMYMWQGGKPDGKINHFLGNWKRRMKDFV